jgi:2-polyprenyl-6-methoxyphenol hydroxylase-like FAD-dependent oxidoreductase
VRVLVVGGGIGGFATALSLHAAGVGCEVFEQSREIGELGGRPDPIFGRFRRDGHASGTLPSASRLRPSASRLSWEGSGWAG